MMLVMQFNFCCLVFVFTKISAAVNNNDRDSNDDHRLVKGKAQVNYPVVNNNATFDSEKPIHLKADRDPTGIQNKGNISKSLNRQDRLKTDNNDNKYLLKKLEALTYQIQNMSEMLTELNGQIEKNISHLSENQISIHDDIRQVRFSLSKPSNGVTYSGLYRRTEPGTTKDNKTFNIPRDCKGIQDRGINVSGVYEIQPKFSPKPILVLCDMETRGGGWTHIQKRFDGSQDFYLGWRQYKFGFGDLDGEFWIGLQNIYSLTSAVSELLIELVYLNQDIAYVHYKAFKIGPETDGYPISILTDFTGDVEDSLKYHFGQKFSTRDYDQDEYPSSCANRSKSGWWFKGCRASDLNGKYIEQTRSEGYYGYWYDPPRVQNEYLLIKTRMLVRPASV